MQVINVNFSDPLEVYKCYMPFLARGGIFYKTIDKYELDTEVECKIKLPNSPQEYTVTGKIKWITPFPANEGFTPGIGIQFLEQQDDLINSIEQIIAGGATFSNHRTYTI